MASDGYPEQYEKGQSIHGLENIEDGFLFHAGTKSDNNSFLVSGGRVLNVIGTGSSLKKAIQDVYGRIDKINFEGMSYRKDIALKGLKKEAL